MGGYVVKICKPLVVVLVMLSLMAIGFAHQTSRTVQSPDMAGFLAAGGSLSDLCGTPVGDGQTTHVECKACRISDNLITLQSCASFPERITRAVLVYGFVAKRLEQSRGLDPARLTRAPPQA